jgi:glycogen operon protein
MILHGDELGRTQQGNNNTYCQDSPLTWIDWDGADTDLIEFTASVARLRRYHPTFRRRRFFDGRPVTRGQGEPLPDIVWMTPSGDTMTDDDWDSDFGRSIAVFLNGRGIRGTDERGQPIVDDSFLLLFNAHDDALTFALPPEEYGAAWNTVIDTAGIDEDERRHRPQQTVTVAGRGMVVLQEAAVETQPEVRDTPPAAAVPEVPPAIQSNGAEDRA